METTPSTTDAAKRSNIVKREKDKKGLSSALSETKKKMLFVGVVYKRKDCIVRLFEHQRKAVIISSIPHLHQHRLIAR